MALFGQSWAKFFPFSQNPFIIICYFILNCFLDSKKIGLNLDKSRSGLLWGIYINEQLALMNIWRRSLLNSVSFIHLARFILVICTFTHSIYRTTQKPHLFSVPLSHGSFYWYGWFPIYSKMHSLVNSWFHVIQTSRNPAFALVLYWYFCFFSYIITISI